MSCPTLISEKKLEKLNKKNISNFQLIKNIPGTDHFQQNAAYVRVFSNWNQFQHFFIVFLYFYSTSTKVIEHTFRSILLKQSFV